ncbi:MAG: helix-turn-helix transcriptional regulator [Bacteroidetes bacterium]|nr:helix-turn-helix transcriptional regulator [Bacteroidota bacterium]
MTLTELRKEKQLKTTDLAARLGISQGYYSNLERGKRPFNDLLLKKTAKILGVRLSTLQEAVKSQPLDSYKLKSWMSGIKINGLPLIKSFYYHLETNGLDIRSLDDLKLKFEMRKFVEINIGFSILAELSENKNLLGHIRNTINTYSFSPKTNMFNKNKNS